MMNVYRKLRLYHAMLASSALAAYATGEAGIVHAWIGYALVGIILFRLAWGMFGPSQFRIGRFLPDLASLFRIRAANDPAIARVLLGGVIASLLLVVGTGIALDRTTSLNLVAEARTVPVPRFDFRPHGASMAHGTTTPNAAKDDDDEKEGWLQELHEFSANLMFLFVGIHVSYMILFRRPLAMFMLFVPGQKRRTA
jgi:cytochrome b